MTDCVRGRFTGETASASLSRRGACASPPGAMRTIEEREDSASEADTAETPFPAAQPINYAQLLLEKRKRFRKTLSLPQIIGRP